MAQLNGKPYTLEEGTTLAELLERLEIRSTRIAVEVNMELIPRTCFADTVLHPDDTIEIVAFVGGG